MARYSAVAGGLQLRLVMRRITLRGRIGAASLALLVLPSLAGAADGAALYRRHCAPCHGIGGRGNGPDADVFANPPRDLRDGFLERYSTDDLVRRVRSGVPLVLALDLPSLKARASEVEALAAYLERLPSLDWRLVEDGQIAYIDHCELCHGPHGKPPAAQPGGARPPRDLSDPAFQKSLTVAELKTVVRHGRDGMPAVEPPVPLADLEPLLAFVRILSPGFALYDRYCTACHGDDGRGTGSFAEGELRPTVVFDRAYFRRRDPEQVRSAVWHMLATQRPAMPHFRHTLTADEARAVITYLKKAE